MTGTLAGKVVLVTGASRGIGRAIARRLARDGALIIVHYGSNRAAAAETAAEIEKAGGEAILACANIASVASIRTMFEEVDAELTRRKGRNRIDILVNNAGTISYSHIEALTEEEFDALFDTNVKGTMFMTQMVLPRLQDGGRIINLSSGTTLRARPELLAYAASKAAVTYIAMALAAELGPRGITVNTLIAGLTRTDMMSDMLKDAAFLQRSVSSTALGRVGEVDDIADAAAFLASHQARWVTGQTLIANGGAYL
jgi:3-oxoacyl-[acyl-carrier protein] reductase